MPPAPSKRRPVQADEHRGALATKRTGQRLARPSRRNSSSGLVKVFDMGNIIRHSSKRPTRQYPTIGVCGLDCGLCPRFYTVGSSRCPGCAGSGFYDKHPTCSFITCCVRNKHLEVCSECSGFFPCAKFKSAEEYKQVTESSSLPIM